MSNPQDRPENPENQPDVQTGLPNGNPAASEETETMGPGSYPQLAQYLPEGSGENHSILDAIDAALLVGFTLNDQEPWEDWDPTGLTGPEPDFPPEEEKIPEYKKHPELNEAGLFLGTALLRRIKLHQLSPTTRAAHELETQILDLLSLEEREVYIGLRPQNLPLGAPLGCPKTW